jgi:DNA-binding beta-propeller fold protein YncE
MGRLGVLTRRSLLGGGVSSLGLFALACAAKKGTGYPGYMLVAAAGDQAINAVDLKIFRLTHRIELNAAPSGVLSSASTPALAVAVTAANGTLHLIDAAKLSKTGSIRIADEIERTRLLPDGKQAAAISRSARQLIITDLTAQKVVKRFRLTAVPQELEVTGSDSKEIRVAVSFGDKGLVQQFNLTAGTSHPQQVSASVGGLRYRKDGQLLFVANYAGRSITVFDGDQLEMVADLPVAMKPETLCFSADQGQLFVGGSGMDAVAIVFVYQPLIVEQTVLAGQSPGAMAASLTPPFLFVASRTGPEINIFSVDTRKVIAVVQASPGTRQILITPDDQFALVLNEYSGDLAVIRIPTIEANRLRSGEINRTKSGASLLTMFPVGDQPVAAAITAMV